MSYVFISYVKENKNKVLGVCNELIQRGIKIWIDVNDLTPGVRWNSEIRRAIEEADFFLAFFSKEFNTKAESHMHAELRLAIERLRRMQYGRIWLIPIRLSGEIPRLRIGAGQTLRDLQYADLKKERERDIERVIQWLQSGTGTTGNNT